MSETVRVIGRAIGYVFILPPVWLYYKLAGFVEVQWISLRAALMSPQDRRAYLTRRHDQAVALIKKHGGT